MENKLSSSRIIVIMPYFGVWPSWINLYLYSCSQNKQIDWLFYTDCPIPKVEFSNLKFKSISFENYCQHVSNILDVGFKPKSAYKICDVRPFFGLVHKEDIKDYHFWGYGDLDIIWGQINNFYSSEIIDKNDFLSTHADRLSGHLSIVRNSDANNGRCFKINDWKGKLESSTHFALDEIAFTNTIARDRKYIIKIYLKVLRKMFNWRDAWVIYYRMMPWINVLTCMKLRRLYFVEQHTTPILSPDLKTFEHDTDLWYYKDGKVINSKTGRETMYLHFMIYKKNNVRKDYIWDEKYYHLPDNYDFAKGVKISRKGFEPL